MRLRSALLVLLSCLGSSVARAEEIHVVGTSEVRGTVGICG